MLVLININPKLMYVQSMFSSIDMTPSTPEIKTSFSKGKEYILTSHLIGSVLNFFLGYPMHIKIISGLVKPGV